MHSLTNEGKDMRKKKRKSPLRRLLRGVKWILILGILFNVVAAYAPFVRLPELSPETARALDRRASEMFEDRETDDRAMIIETSRAALDERLRLIEQARREIVIVTYENQDRKSVV